MRGGVDKGKTCLIPMKIHRFIGDYDLDQHELALTDRAQVRQMRDVLRLKKSEWVILGDGKGYESEAEIVSLSPKEIHLALLGKRQNVNESQRRTTLYCSLLKRENFEWVVQKAVEVGVATIVPIIAARTVTLACRKDRLQKIIHEAVEQSGRGVVPVLSEPMPLTDAEEHASLRHDLLIFFDASGDSSVHTLVRTDFKIVSIFIGPEGGWTSEEIAVAREKKIPIAHLGTLTLRAETAAVVASYLISVNTRIS